MNRFRKEVYFMSHLSIQEIYSLKVSLFIQNVWKSPSQSLCWPTPSVASFVSDVKIVQNNSCRIVYFEMPSFCIIHYLSRTDVYLFCVQRLMFLLLELGNNFCVNKNRTDTLHFTGNICSVRCKWNKVFYLSYLANDY